MLSQALEGVADLIASGLLVIGLNRSRRRADTGHPFGYGRELYFWTLISALIMLFVTSTITILIGIQKISYPKMLEHTTWAYIVLIIGACTNGYALSLSVRRILNKHHFTKIVKYFYHSSLIETKTTLVLDLMGTSATMVGLVALIMYGITGDGRYDGYGAVAIGLILACLAVFLLIGIKDFLIGKSVSLSTIDLIRGSVNKIEHINSIQDLKAIHMGPENILINIEVNAKDGLTTDELEQVIDKVKDEIRKDLPSAKHIQVELESGR